MKAKLLLIILALTALQLTTFVARAADDDAAIVAAETQMWEAYKNKQGDTFKAAMAPEYAGVYSYGIRDVNGELSDMKNVEFRSYSFSNSKTTHPTPNVAVITFVCALQASANGKDVSGNYNCGSVYVQQNGKWLGVYHSEALQTK